MTRISKRVREEAANWLSAIASSDFDEDVPDGEIAQSLGISSASLRFAECALWQAPVRYVCRLGDPDDYRFLAADCEALVREGWSP